MATRKTIGLQGEQEAVRYLRKQGYQIIAHRERILRGDIDIIALDKRTVVFIEVRSRTSTHHGHPAETIDARKKQRICTLANAYIKQHRLEIIHFGSMLLRSCLHLLYQFKTVGSFGVLVIHQSLSISRMPSKWIPRLSLLAIQGR